MTATRMSCAALCFAGFEMGLWLVFVPSSVTTSTFLIVNAVAAAMFCVGFASAANGLPARSVTQLLHDLEKGPHES